LTRPTLSSSIKKVKPSSKGKVKEKK